jgi:hypothetical protein
VLICGAGSDLCIAAVYIVEEVGLLVEPDSGLKFLYRLAETKEILRQSRVCSITLQHARAGSQLVELTRYRVLMLEHLS